MLIHVKKESNTLSQGTEKSDYSLLEYRAILFGFNGLERRFKILFFYSFIAHSVYTRGTEINYKIVPETNFNKYLHCGTRGSE